MLRFNQLGYLVPNKPISSNIDELEKYFVIEYSSVERSKLFEQYIRYNKELKELCYDVTLSQWVNGSFVTKSTPRPNDIDIVTFIDGRIIEKLKDKLKPFTYPRSKKNYPGVDAYIVADNNRVTKLDKAYWHHQFDTTRRNTAGKILPKGFIEINF